MRETEKRAGWNECFNSFGMVYRARTAYLVISDNCPDPQMGRTDRTKSKTQNQLHKAVKLVRRSRTDNSPLRLVSKAVSSENISEYVLKADRSESEGRCQRTTVACLARNGFRNILLLRQGTTVYVIESASDMRRDRDSHVRTSLRTSRDMCRDVAKKRNTPNGSKKTEQHRRLSNRTFTPSICSFPNLNVS